MFKQLKNNHSLFTYLLLVSVTIIPFLLSMFYERPREEDIVFIFINSAILFFPLFFTKNHRTYLIFVFPLLLISALIDFVHIILYQGRITESIFFIIFDTNPAESLEYFESNLNWKLVSLCVLYISSMFYYWFKVIQLDYIKPSTPWKKFLLIWILAPFVFKLILSKGDLTKTTEAYQRSNHFYSLAYNYYRYNEQMKNFTDFSSKIRTQFDIKRVIKEENETYVLIVGESTTRNKMSLYGYHRDTTPRLNKLKNDLIVFPNAYSSASGTLANLKRIMTLANKENQSDELLSSNIVNIMKAAKFKTYWISNQLVLGQHDTITTVFAKQADRSSFTNTTNSITYDEKTLPILEKYLQEPVQKKFIVLHLIGTHMVYKSRYPENFNYFKNTHDIAPRKFHNNHKLEYINHYDNAILYHDYILSKALELIKKHSSYSAVLYLSDHGEEVYDIIDFHGHPSNNETQNIFEIPFFIWLSEDYKKKNTWQHSFNNFLNRTFISDDVIHTLFEISDTYPEEYNAEKSVINPMFIEKKLPKFIKNDLSK